MENQIEFWAEVNKHNSDLLASIRAPKNEIDAITGSCYVTDKMEVVDGPLGDDQHEDYEFFKKVFVDQVATPLGETGEYNYSGHIYAKFGKKKWLKIPYEC